MMGFMILLPVERGALFVKDGVAICLVDDVTLIDQDVGVTHLPGHLTAHFRKHRVALGPVRRLQNQEKIFKKGYMPSTFWYYF